MNTDKLDTLITFLESQNDAVVTAMDLARVLKEIRGVIWKEKDNEDWKTSKKDK